MKRYIWILFLFSIMFCLGFSDYNSPRKRPFGTEADVTFANDAWQAIEGYEDWLIKSDYYEGQKPHGEILRTYFSIIHINGNSYHTIVKDNFGGKDADVETVSKNPDKYLKVVTIMVKREDGYDPDNNNWFWVKYSAGGEILKNDKGMALAGRVAKGMNTGCIACHSGAEGNDYVFFNDK